MAYLLVDKKIRRIKALSIQKETRGFIHEECFNTHFPPLLEIVLDIVNGECYN
jgi:hypothetical protein